MAFNRQHIAVAELAPNEQKQIRNMDKQTDDIFALRCELAFFYDRYAKYLPFKTKTVNQKDDTTRTTHTRVGIDQISKQVLAGVKLEDLLPLDKIQQEISAEGLSHSSVQETLRRLQLIKAFEHACAVANELRTKGGAWKDEKPTPAKKRLREYYRTRWHELGAAAQDIEALRAQVQEIETLRTAAQQDPQFSGDPELLRAIEDQYTAVFQKIEKEILEKPEAYGYVLAQQIRHTKELFDQNGRIVETPYITSRKERVKSIIASGRPVFIHGELGAGKTEFARYLAQELSVAYLGRWEKEHPKPTGDPEAFKHWQAERILASAPLMIGGYRDIEPEKITGSRTVRRKEPVAPEDQLKKIREGWTEYETRYDTETAGRGGDFDDIKSKKLESTDKRLYEEAYLRAFENPVEVLTILGPLLQAQKEGRPFIIDEINAIPHHVLIIMNDLMMRRPGERVTPQIPGAETYIVQEGFCVLATGNYRPEEGGTMYVKREPLDAAFLSRCGLVRYDYLPVPSTLEPRGLSPDKQREFRAGNELFQMMGFRLLNEDLSLTLPEKGLTQLKRLVHVARQLQNAFSGMDVDTSWYAQVGTAKVKLQEVLKENVLSIRHLIPIIDQWKREGFVRDLDEYLFLDYISRSDARPNEKLYLYQILKVQGDFFPDAKGWPPLSERNNILAFDSLKQMYGRDAVTGLKKPLSAARPSLQRYPLKRVIEEFYGPFPERTQALKGIRIKKELPPQEEPDTEGDLERDRTIARINMIAQTLHDEHGIDL